ncbi:MAG TPA: glycosyltransferase [Dehalococcoidia bacterium]|nr:glycosyltransferase [Dehalococcoidia bacterium]
MYGTLALASKALDDYAPIVGEAQIERIRELARPLKGLRVLNLSVTSLSTGVADLLSASVPLLTDVGLDACWQAVRASDEFLPVTKAMYVALAGGYVPWTQEMCETWERYSAVNAELLAEPFDVVVVHDPQPAGIRTWVEERGGGRMKWVLHSHLDLSTAQEDVWMVLKGHIDRYDRVVFPAPAFARPDIRAPITIIEPAIDPLSPRNTELSDEVVTATLTQYGVDPARPLVVQISPTAPGFDMVGAIRVCEQARRETPGLQLLLAPLCPPEDPMSRNYFDEVARIAVETEDVFFVACEVGNTEMNVFQRAADVVLQKALAKGFGLWVTDALWKRKAVVASAVHGLTQQVIDGETGLCPTTDEGFAEAIVRLIRDRELARRLGERGHELVRRRFLITRFLEDTLRLLADVMGERR